jgi:hypothetical protein
MDSRAPAPRGSRDAAALTGISVTLVLFLLAPFVLHGFRFPLGPDAPVYLWWTRLAAHDGLSAVPRPGVPALALVLAGTLHAPLAAVVAALEVALGVAVGLASAALVRAAGGTRAAWVLAGILAGTFTVHLAAGYLANLAFAALFLAAAVALAEGARRSTAAAALLLGAGGLAHPMFLLVGATILVIAAAQAWRSSREEAVRVGIALVAGAAVTGVGLLALLAGPGAPSVDTSRDGFLRRAGLTDVLRHAYLDRFIHRWTRYVQWASIPLAVYGLRDARGFVGRFLRAWGIVLVGGVAVGLATGLFPADRFITFGYAVPILAAFGLMRLWRALAARRALAMLAAAALAVAMVAGSWIAWARQEPFLSPLEVERATAAASLAAGTAPGATLVFLVNDVDATVSFLATRAGNVIRASMPADRIRDVVVRVPWPEPGARPPTERWKLAHLSADDARAAERAGNGRSVTFVLAPFDRVDMPSTRGVPGMVAPGVFISSPTLAPRPVADPLEPSSPGQIAITAIGVLVLLSAIGYGWARLACERFTAGALSPAFGAGALVLFGIALERVGLPLSGWADPSLVSALAGLCGYGGWLILERRARADAAHEVDAEPHE